MSHRNGTKLSSAVLAVMLAASTLSGCATVFKTKTTAVQVTSTIPGAEVFVNDQQVGVTPTTVQLTAKTDAVISVHRADKQQTCKMESHAATGWVVADIFLTSGIGLIVDWATHAWNDVKPNNCHVDV